MATWTATTKLALALPETVEQRSKEGRRLWRVKDRTFAWERPLRRSDLEALGEHPPTGAILAVYVPDLETKDAMVTGRGDVYFTTPHFNGYPVVLIRLALITVKELREALSEAWRVRAPRRLLSEGAATPRATSKPKPQPTAKTTRPSKKTPQPKRRRG